MKKRIFSVLLGAALAVSVATAVNAFTPAQENTADAMKELGLFLGYENGDYGLDDALTRGQGITIVVRMLGKGAEAEANVDTYEFPFADVPAWAAPYVGYAYANGITAGKTTPSGELIFDTDASMEAHEFITWALRALDYKDTGDDAQFVWNAPYEFAAEKGLVETTDAIEGFVRGNAVDVFWNALEANVANTELTLAAKLIEAGVFTVDAYEAAKATQKGDADAETTVADEETTVADEETTVADEETTVADEETTVADEETTVADEETTAADEETTVADENDDTVIELDPSELAEKNMLPLG